MNSLGRLKLSGLIFFVLAVMLTACGANKPEAAATTDANKSATDASPQQEQPAATRTYTDATSKEITIPALRKHIKFQEMLCFLFAQKGQDSQRSDSQLAVERTITLLQQRFQENVAVEELAEQAQIGLWQYRKLSDKIRMITLPSCG